MSAKLADKDKPIRVHLHLYGPDRVRLETLYEQFQARSGLKVSRSFFLRWLLWAVEPDGLVGPPGSMEKAEQGGSTGKSAVCPG